MHGPGTNLLVCLPWFQPNMNTATKAQKPNTQKIALCLALIQAPAPHNKHLTQDTSDVATALAHTTRGISLSGDECSASPTLQLMHHHGKQHMNNGPQAHQLLGRRMTPTYTIEFKMLSTHA